MSALPTKWQMLPLGDIGRWFGGGTPSKANPKFWTGGSIPWVSPKDMKCDLITDARDHITEDAVAQSATNLVETGSVLIVVRSGILQHTLPVAVAQRQVALNQDLKAVKPRETVRPDYLALALKAFEREILHTCTKTGTTVQSLEVPVFLRFQIPVAPLSEQHEIVAEIEKQFTRLEAGVAGLRRVQANLKRYRAAVLKAACEGKLVPTEAELAKERAKEKVAAASRRWSSAQEQSRDGSATLEDPGYETGAQLLERILVERREKWSGKGKYKEPAEPETTNLPELPEGWAWARLAVIAVLKGGITVDKNRKSATARRIPYLRVANVQRGYLDLNEIKQIDAPESDIADLRLLPGDILFTEGGDRDKLGRGWIWDGQVAECIHQNHVFRARLLSSVISPKLISWWGNSYGQIHFLREGKQTTNLASINLTKLSEFPIPVPPIAEQQRIVAEVERRLSVIEELEGVVNANLQRATRLRQSILQRAFAGESEQL